MKLLVVMQAPDWGGAEEWILSLCTQLIKNHNYQIRVCTNLPRLADALEKVGCEVVHLPYTLDIIGNWKGLLKTILVLPSAWFFYQRLLKQAHRDGYDHLLMSGFTEKLLVSHLSKTYRFRVFWYEYAGLSSVFGKNLGLPRWLYLHLVSVPSKVITISKNSRLQLINDGLPPDKVKLIYPGVRLPLKTNTLVSEPIVGCLARIAPEKGQRILLDAFAQVAKQIPEAKLLIAGSGPDLDFLKSQVKLLKLERQVHLLGFVTAKDKFYRQLQLFAYPGVWEMEGFGLVVAEAMSHSLPVVVFDQFPMSEVVGGVGYKVKSKSASQLATAMLELLRQPSLLESLGNNGRNRVNKLFEINSQVTKVHQVLINE